MSSFPDSTSGAGPDFLNSGSPPPTELEQLEAALRSGAITPELFATLKAKLQESPPVGAADAAPQPNADATSPTVPPRPEPTAGAELPSLISLFENAPAAPASPAPPPASQPPTPRPEPASPSPQPVPVPSPVPDFLPPPRPAAAPPTIPSATPEFLPPASPARPAAPAAATGPPQLVPPPTAPPTAAPPALPTDPEEPRRSGLNIALILVILLCLLGGVAYYFVTQSHPNENLSAPEPTTEVAGSPSVTAPVPAATPEPAQPEPEPAPAPVETTPAPQPSSPEPTAADDDTPAEVAENTPAAPAPAAGPAASPATAGVPGSTAPLPAAPEAGDDAATVAVRTVLARYYADLFAPPLRAENYFAPQVERLYIQRDLTPAQINATIGQTFFPDNQQAVYQVEPGTLRVSEPVRDGSRTATYIERARIFRVSLGRYQRLRTQVRVRFDKENRITYMRQEKLLLNTFE